MLALLVLLALGICFGFHGPKISMRARPSGQTMQLQMRSYGPSSGYIAQKNGGTKSTSNAMTVNLTKIWLELEFFSLSAKVAQISGSTSIMGPVSAMVLALASWATYNFYTLSEVCRITNASTYPEAWGRTISQKSKFIVSIVIVLAPMIACLSNTIVLTDVFSTLLKRVGAPAAISGNRNIVIALLSSLIFYPLCVKKDLGNLKSASALGLLGHLSLLDVLLKEGI